MEGRIAGMKERMNKAWNERMRILQDDSFRQKQRLDSVLEMKEGFREALMSHKRELLIEHKMSSAAVQKNLAELSERKQDLSK